jgi:hypothetical protein
MLAQVAFEAAAGKQAGVLAALCDEHERTGLAVGRALRFEDNPEYERATSDALTLEQGEEGG